jgi:hypothetical protein
MSTLTATPTVATQAAIRRVFPDDYPPVHTRGITLHPDPRDVSTARRFIRDYGHSRGISESVLDDILLCASEVIGNWRHAFFPPGRRHGFMQIRQLGPFVSVAVFDPDPRLPVLRDGVSDLDAESGRGLSSIVAVLACRLEFGPSAHGLKRVSFVVDALPSKSF